MIHYISKQLLFAVQENLAKAGFPNPQYNEQILNMVLDIRDPYSPDISGILDFPRDKFISAAFMLILYHECGSPVAWQKNFSVYGDITAREITIRNILNSPEGKIRHVHPANDPFCIEEKADDNKNKYIKFEKIL